jgi:hypothetical protein
MVPPGGRHGSVKGEANLGLMYVKGRGVRQDYAEARKWFRLAADHGNVSALNHLGAIYALGKGVPQSYAEASKYYRQAAGRGDTQAASLVTRIKDAQAREKERAQPVSLLSSRTPIEPSIFRFSSPEREERIVSFGGPPGGYRPMASHFMAPHFGRR